MKPTPYDKDIGALAAKTIEPDGVFGRQLTVLRARQEGYREALAHMEPCRVLGKTIQKLLEFMEANYDGTNGMRIPTSMLLLILDASG